MTDELGPTIRNWIDQTTRDELRARVTTLELELVVVNLKLRDTVPLGVHLRTVKDLNEVIERYRRRLEQLRKTTGTA